MRVLLSFLLSPELVDGQEVTFTTTILSQPQEKFGQLTFPVILSNGWGDKRISVITPSNDLQYGQRIQVTGSIKAKVLDNKSIVYSISFPKIEAVQERNSLLSTCLVFFDNIRQKIQNIYARAMTKDEASLLLGIVLGVKGDFSQDMMAAFKSTGVMHVIAASGMNVTLLGGFLVSLLGRYFKRQHVGLWTILVLLFYCLLAGFQASIVRATIMGSLGLIAQLSGRQYSGMYGLFVAASCMLLLSPTLIQDVGFQLSFASSLGILLLHPHIVKIPFIGDDISTTISSQIATLPILLITFGQYGVLSILVNALVLWTVAPLMIVGGVAAIIGLVISPFGSMLSLLALPLLWYFEKVVSWFGSLHMILSVENLPMVWVVGYYLVVISVVWMFQTKNGLKEDQV